MRDVPWIAIVGMIGLAVTTNGTRVGIRGQARTEAASGAPRAAREDQPTTATPTPLGGGAPGSTPTPTNWIDEMVIEGLAFDAGSAAEPPVSGARVYAHMHNARCDASTVTDATGRFQLSCHDIFFFENGLEVHVVADGFQPWIHQRGVVNFRIALEAGLEPAWRGGPGPSPTPADSPRYLRTWGQVRRSFDGLPIAMARIEASPLPGRCLSPVYSDEAGDYELVCPDLDRLGSVEFRAIKRGYRDWSGVRSGASAGGRMDIELDFVSMPPTLSPPTLSPSPTPTSTPTPTGVAPTAGFTATATPPGPWVSPTPEPSATSIRSPIWLPILQP
ncbi:MAG: hypothetical protein KDH92_11770 [Chloroflexi bacterium]|nr:hypothetical protein [Chloroflexota bacterium]